MLIFTELEDLKRYSRKAGQRPTILQSLLYQWIHRVFPSTFFQPWKDDSIQVLYRQAVPLG